MACDYQELGEKMIGDIRVQGIEVKDPPMDDESLANAVGRLWVDVETQLPVRIEIEGTADSHTVQWIMDFRWAEAVDPGVFEPNITDDFTLITD